MDGVGDQGPGNQTRICTLCRRDCTKLSRTRDRNGNYYCTVCYEGERIRRRKRHAARTGPFRLPTGDETHAFFWSEFSPVALAARCIDCGSTQPPGAAFCASCGLDPSAGERHASVVE